MTNEATLRTVSAIAFGMAALIAPSRVPSQPRALPNAASDAVAPAPVRAEPLTLRQALEIARTSAPGARVADARRDIATGRVRELAQFTNPTLEYRRENLGSPLQPDIFATVVLPFDVTGRRLALRQAGAQGQQRATADAIVDHRDTELRVARAWLRAVFTDAQLVIAQNNATALAEVATVDSTRAAEGFVAEGIALRTRLESGRARATLAALDGDRARARADLSRALGVADDQLTDVASLERPPLPNAPDSATVRRLAQRLRPELVGREAAVREAESRLGAERRGAFGEWQLQGGTKQTAGYLTGQIGLAVPFPLFNRNDGAKQRARGEVADARALRDEMLVGVAADAVAALHHYNAVRALADEAQTFADRGREVSTIARAAYAEGQASLLELLDAERAATDAITAHLRWTADAWLARLELESAIGARLDSDGPLNLPLLASLPNGS
jgi:cobalt-zinc-cadmium efflux system outer membrane protein